MAQEEQERHWRQALSQLNTWKRGDQRAVHKPLLTLMLIARATSKAPRRIHFAEIADSLTRFLKEFGPSRRSYHPEFPFWHLQNDGFWVIENKLDFPLKPRGRSPAKRLLIEHDAVGAVPEEPLGNPQTEPVVMQGAHSAAIGRILAVHFTRCNSTSHRASPTN